MVRNAMFVIIKTGQSGLLVQRAAVCICAERFSNILKIASNIYWWQRSDKGIAERTFVELIFLCIYVLS